MVQEKIAGFAWVVSYDRAGLGWSGDAAHPLTARNAAEDLHGLMTAIGNEDGAAVSIDGLSKVVDVDHGSSITMVDVPALLPAGVSYDAATDSYDIYTPSQGMVMLRRQFSILTGLPEEKLRIHTRDVGGSFAQVPACRDPGQFGCVVSYASFRESSPPPDGTFFARAQSPGTEALCTNPAALAGA